MELDKWDNYLIRACKNCDGLIIERLYQVWKWRCMLPNENNKRDVLLNVSWRLFDIIDELKLATGKELIQSLHREDWRISERVEDKQLNRLLDTAITIIQRTPRNKFPDNFYMGSRWGSRKSQTSQTSQK